MRVKLKWYSFVLAHACARVCACRCMRIRYIATCELRNGMLPATLRTSGGGEERKKKTWPLQNETEANCRVTGNGSGLPEISI